jgi:Arc/MetJ-type ribon-helix-helix transcriptional regulator
VADLIKLARKIRYDKKRLARLGAGSQDVVQFRHRLDVQMNLSLDPEVQKLIDERVKSGLYATPEDVVAAALLTLDQQEWLGDFASGELDSLLAEGEKSIMQEGTLDGNEAYQLRRARRAGKQAP